MLKDDPNLKAQYRMPRVFGALPGPRNVPKDKQNLPNNQHNVMIAVTVLTDAKKLAELLPPDCELEGEPLLTVSENYMMNIGWLGGHDYTIVNVAFRIAHHSKTRGRLVGNFLPVLWENLADPILTGREELGFGKLFADMPPVRVAGDCYGGSASWQGFRFFEIEAVDLTEQSLDVPAAPGVGAFHYKFIPKTGELGAADVEYLQYAAPGTPTPGYTNPPVVRRLAGRGHYKFHSARWEDVPFQYPIINFLAGLPVLENRGTVVTHSQATGTIGDTAAGALREVD